MALLKEVEDYVITKYANHLLDIQIEEKYQEMWAEIDKILEKDKEKWENRRLKKLEYYEIIQKLKNQKT